MIEKNIKIMKELALRNKEEIDIKDVFDTICKSIEMNIDLINECSAIETGYTFKVDELKEAFTPSKNNTYGNIDAPYLNNYGRVTENMVPLGVVGLKVDKNISIVNYLEIIKVALETRNSLAIQPYQDSKTLGLIVAIINDIIIQTQDLTEILLVESAVNLDHENDLDALIYVGDKEGFYHLNFNKQKIYLGIGIYELYVHEVLDEKLIEFALANRMTVYKREENDKNVYDRINATGGNYCSAIMTSDKEKAREFIANVHSSHVLVNLSPALIFRANLSPEQLLKRKAVVVYK